ncbi:Putative cytochrome P450 [Septoria linicola]|uniref:Cytochrome P450 n=1 Tax=Septoria linicola TaxID=215465 RepID=A0A9Q9B1V7_9PEZI|nr:putative cytochrome P450 [Septoria linicola]USW59434.1 Putative cytochrome P450 [Septoria linicola]
MRLDYVICLLSIVFVVVLYRRIVVKDSLPLPPGPKGYPIVGNTLQIPKEHAWRQYLKWSKMFGPVYSLNIAGSTFIIISSYEAAHELLNKRAANSSDRPRMIMANDLSTKGLHPLLRPYNAMYRVHQRMQHPVLKSGAATSYASLYELKTLQMLNSMLSASLRATGPVQSYLETCNLGIVYALVYGEDVNTGREQIVQDTIKIQRKFGEVTKPGAYLVDTFPVMNLLPKALAPWKAEAEALYAEESTMHLRNLANGLRAEGWNITKQLAASPEAKEMSRVELAYSLGITLHAGFDTTTMILEWFIIACLKYPACLRCAQTELDEVVGRDRLPFLHDKDKMPYLGAMVEEVLRWRNIMNAGFPHLATAEGSYLGYRIPKNAVLLPQYHAMDVDEAVYEHPNEFIPERWLKGNLPAGGPLGAFGFGRRLCPGRNIARNTIWLVMARIIRAFDLRHATDDRGQQIDVDADSMETGFNTRPTPFVAQYESRGEWARSVVEKEWMSTDQDVARVLTSLGRLKTSNA